MPPRPANWFVALPVDPGDWFAKVPIPPSRIRRFHPDDLHLTVAFFGAVGAEAAHRAWGGITPPPHVDVTLGAVVPMGRPDRYSALSVRLDQGRELVEAWMSLVRDDLLEAAGARPARHPVTAHCTLARPMRRATEAERAAGLAWAASVDLSGTRVHLGEAALYTWADERNTRLFRIVARCPATPTA